MYTLATKFSALPLLLNFLTIHGTHQQTIPTNRLIENTLKRPFTLAKMFTVQNEPPTPIPRAQKIADCRSQLNHDHSIIRFSA